MLYIILAPLSKVLGQVIPHPSHSHSRFITTEILGNLDTKEHIAQNLVVPQTMIDDEESFVVILVFGKFHISEPSKEEKQD